MFCYTVHYNLPQDPFVLNVYYFFYTNDIPSLSPTNLHVRFHYSLPN
jgi:hypothetical protein